PGGRHAKADPHTRHGDQRLREPLLAAAVPGHRSSTSVIGRLSGRATPSTRRYTDHVIERRKTKQISVGSVAVGGDAPISVQSMCITNTADYNATLQQIAALAASGCDIVRVAVPDTDDVEALPIIARKSTIPVIADIH